MQIIHSAGFSLSSREFDDDDIIRHLKSISEDRTTLEQRVNQLVELEEKVLIV